MEFFIVPEEVVNQYQNTVQDGNGLFFRQDKNGRWVVNCSVCELWGEIDWQSFEVVNLTSDDFPITEN